MSSHLMACITWPVAQQVDAPANQYWPLPTASFSAAVHASRMYLSPLHAWRDLEGILHDEMVRAMTRQFCRQDQQLAPRSDYAQDLITWLGRLQVACPHAAYQVVGGWKLQKAWVRVFGLDSFFVPCAWMDHDCHEAISLLHQSNSWLPDDLIGHHHYLGSWLSDVEPNPKQLS